MSRDVLVKFYVGDKFEREICFNILKNVLDSGYIVEMSDYAISGVDPEAGVRYYEDYLGLFPRKPALEIQPEDYVGHCVPGNYFFRLKLARGAEEKFKEFLYEPTTEEIVNKTLNPTDYYELYYDAKEEYRGNWYNTHSIELAMEKFKSAYTEKMRRVFKLETIVDSEKFYTLNEDQRYELKEDIASLKEDIADIEWSIRACTSLIDYVETISFSGNVSMFIYVV